MTLTRHLLVALLGTAMFSSLPAQAGFEASDIAGVRIGMTGAEAEAALKAHNSELAIKKQTITYSYDDGVTSHRTPEILSVIEGYINKITSPTTASSEQFILMLSGLPGEEVVTAIKRNQSGITNPTSKAAFIEALTAKYGAPTEVRGILGNMPFWTDAPGKHECFNVEALMPAARPLMDNVRQRDPNEIAQCPSTLAYSLTEDPVVGFNVGMVDAKLTVSLDEKIQNWVNQLEEDARKKVAERAQAPKL